MMIVLRIWLILSVSAAAPLNSKGDKERLGKYLVIDDIMNGDDMDADGLHSHTSQNARFVINADQISFSNIGTVIFSNPPDHMPLQYHESASGPASDLYQESAFVPASDPVCQSMAINTRSCICKSMKKEEEENCLPYQGCTDNGKCIEDCPRWNTGKEHTDCMCKSPFGEIAVCTAGQMCQHGVCLRDPEPCKEVKKCYDDTTRKFCPITCNQDQPDFCEIMKIEGCNSEFAKEYCEACIDDCDKDASRNQEVPLEDDCMCSQSFVKEACRKGYHCLDQKGCACQDEEICPDPDAFLMFLLFG